MSKTKAGAPSRSQWMIPSMGFPVVRDCLDLNLALRQSPFDRGIENREVSAIVADAVVDTVVFFLNLVIERRRTRRLRNAGPINGRAGPGNIVLPEKLPRRRPAEFRGAESAVVLRSGSNACHQRGRDDDDERH